MTQLKNIMVSQYGKEDVLIRGTRLTINQLRDCFKRRKVTISDIYEVSEDDIQYHIFDLMIATAKFDSQCLQ